MRNESNIVIQFSYDKVFIACVKTIENSGWSRSQIKAFVVDLKDYLKRERMKLLYFLERKQSLRSTVNRYNILIFN